MLKEYIKPQKKMEVALIFIFLIFIGYQLAPYWKNNSQLEGSFDTRGFIDQQIVDTQSGTRFTKTYTLPFTGLIDAHISIITSGERGFGENVSPYRASFVAQKIELAIKYDRLILYFGTYLIFIFTISALLPASFSIRKLSFKAGDIINSDENSEEKVSIPKDENGVETLGKTTEDILENEVITARKRSEELFSRSNVLLGGGIIMAFVGIAIFYLTLPPLDTSSG